MSQTFLDIPAIVQEILRREIDHVTVDVVENIYEAPQKIPMIKVGGDDPVVEPLGKGLAQYNTPVRVACWHKTDSDADTLRTAVIDVFKVDANRLDPLDKDGNTYGIKLIDMNGYESEDVRTMRGNRFGRILSLDVQWYFVYS